MAFSPPFVVWVPSREIRPSIWDTPCPDMASIVLCPLLIRRFLWCCYVWFDGDDDNVSCLDIMK